MLQSTMIAGVALVAASVATTGDLVTLMSGADRSTRDAVAYAAVPQEALLPSQTAHGAFCEIEALAASMKAPCERMRTASLR